MRLLGSACPISLSPAPQQHATRRAPPGTFLGRTAHAARRIVRTVRPHANPRAGLRAVLLLALAALPGPAAERVVGYFSNWGMYDAEPYTWREVPYSKLTHINYAFFAPGAQGAIRSSDSWADGQQLAPLVDSAHQAGVRVLASIGGWTLSDSFPAMASTDATRKAFAASARRLVQDHDLDGIDLDWEFPGAAERGGTPQDSTNLLLLLRTLRDTLDAIGGGKLLTMAVPASPYNGRHFPLSRMAPLVDWLGVMTYDMTGPWEDPGTPAWHNSPLFGDGDAAHWSTAQAVAYWIGRGLPRDKFLIGLAFYGRTFAGATAPRTAITGPGSGDGYAPYSAIAARLAAGACIPHVDTVSQVPWCLSTAPAEYVSYDDPRSIARKARFLREEGLGGAILWELKEDRLADGRQPLIDTLDAVLRSSSSRIQPHSGREPSVFQAKRTSSGWEFRFADGQARRFEILAADGRRVWSATGSTATWDGRDASGARISTGIHLAHVPASGSTLVLPP